MTTHIGPAKTTRCKAHLTDGTKLSNATIGKNGQVCGYIKNSFGRRLLVVGRLDGTRCLTDDHVTSNGKRGYVAPINTASVSWKDANGNVICPV